MEELKNPRQHRAEKKLEKSGLAVLEHWDQLLSAKPYKNHFEIVEFFCRFIIPFIQKHSDLQSLMTGWRKNYEAQLVKNNVLQKQVLEETSAAFKKIAAAVENPTELVKLKIADIENVLNGKPGSEGYTSRPQYVEAHSAIKELLKLVFDEGMQDLCANYVTFDTWSRYVEKDGKNELINEKYIAKFTFSSTIEKAVQAEAEFINFPLQDPVKVWSYFEAALYFWNMTDSDIRENLECLRKVHPLRAASQQSAWREINQVKSRQEGHSAPVIFTTELFREGLRTIINEVILANV